MDFDARLSLQKLEILCLVVDLGGVTPAAQHLFVTQPVVTSHLHALNAQVGTPLLVREGNRLQLTDAGKVFVPWAREVLTRAREVARELDGLAGAEAGSALIYASMSVGSYLLPPVLLDFLHTRPRARLSLSIADPEVAMDATERGECDFAVVFGEGLARPGLEIELLGYETLALVAAPQSPVPDVLTPSDLSRTPFVCSPRDHVRRRVIDLALSKAGVRERNVVIEFGHPEAMKAAVRRGVGVTLAFRCSVQEDLASGVLREVQIAGIAPAAAVFLMRRSAKRVTPLQGALIDFIRDRLAERLIPRAGIPHD